jgi:hypothetical protein
VVVDVGCAARAVVAVNSLAWEIISKHLDIKGARRLTRVTVVLVLVELALCDLDVALGNDLVEGVCSAAEDLAGVAVAVDVLVRMCRIR